VQYSYDAAEAAKVLKLFPTQVFGDQSSCELAGHEWTSFVAGEATEDRAPPDFKGEVTPGCWIRAELLSDGWKSCAQQSDCIGNCLAAIVDDGQQWRAAGGYCQPDKRNFCHMVVMDGDRAVSFPCPPS
jgi:hypothetical protein